MFKFTSVKLLQFHCMIVAFSLLEVSYPHLGTRMYTSTQMLSSQQTYPELLWTNIKYRNDPKFQEHINWMANWNESFAFSFLSFTKAYSAPTTANRNEGGDEYEDLTQDFKIQRSISKGPWWGWVWNSNKKWWRLHPQSLKYPMLLVSLSAWWNCSRCQVSPVCILSKQLNFSLSLIIWIPL